MPTSPTCCKYSRPLLHAATLFYSILLLDKRVIKVLGPVVQSIVSLTRSLVVNEIVSGQNVESSSKYNI